jgi:hypothetical protein
MANKRSFCFIIAFHNFATLKNRLTYPCASSWPVVITLKKKLAGTWKIYIGYWPVQMNGNKFATGEILEKPVEVVKGRILAGWAQRSSEPWPGVGHVSEKALCRSPLKTSFNLALNFRSLLRLKLSTAAVLLGKNRRLFLPMNQWSLRNNYQLKLKASGELLVILEESMVEYTSNEWK